MLVFQQNINDLFNELLNDLDCHYDTKSYIIGIYNKYRTSEFDFSKDSVTLLFAQGRLKQDFYIYQNLGDWLFYTNTIAPKHLRHASKEYYDTIARLSYYSCYKLINHQWKLYEQLADEFIYLTDNIRNKLITSAIKLD